MIYFNGTALEAVAPVKIEDIHVAPIPRNVTARQRPILPGADFVRATDGVRTVAISFGLLTQDMVQRARQLAWVMSWARSEQPQRLELPYHEGRHFLAICTAFPEPSMRQWWESKLRLVFSCYDPFWRANDEKSVACGTAFSVLGDAPPLMRITNTFAEAASDVAYTDGTDTMTFSAVAAGDLEIDLNAQTAALDGASIMSAYEFGSTFLRPRTGSQTITGAGVVHWRERWV